MRLQPNRIHHPSRKEVHVLTQSEIKLSDLFKRFAKTVDEKLHSCPTNSIKERWDNIRDAIYSFTVDAFGEKGRQNPELFEAGINNLEQTIAANRKVLIDYKRDQPGNSLAALRKARNDAPQIGAA